MKSNTNIYFKCVKSLGSLTEISIEKNEVEVSKFGYKMLKESENNEYGSHAYYQLDVFHEGQFKDFKIKDYSYSHFMKLYHRYYKTTYENYRRLTFSCEKDNGEIVSESVEISNALDNSVAIILALIFYTQFRSNDKFNMYWKLLFSPVKIYDGDWKHASLLSLGEAIDILQYFKKDMGAIIEEYPIVNKIIVQRINYRINEIERILQKHQVLKRL